jgi:hypothetical protein
MTTTAFFDSYEDIPHDFYPGEVLGYVVAVQAAGPAEPAALLDPSEDGAPFATQREAEEAALELQNQAVDGECYVVGIVTVPAKQVARNEYARVTAMPKPDAGKDMP